MRAALAKILGVVVESHVGLLFESCVRGDDVALRRSRKKPLLHDTGTLPRRWQSPGLKLEALLVGLGDWTHKCLCFGTVNGMVGMVGWVGIWDFHQSVCCQWIISLVPPKRGEVPYR